MRGLPSTLILVVVLAGLGAYIYFVDSKKPEGGSGPDDAKKTKVFSLDVDKIDELKVSAGGETSVLKKSADGWKMIEPAQVDADAAEAINVAQGLSNIESSRTVDENPADLKEYGLA